MPYLLVVYIYLVACCVCALFYMYLCTKLIIEVNLFIILHDSVIKQIGIEYICRKHVEY